MASSEDAHLNLFNVFLGIMFRLWMGVTARGSVVGAVYGIITSIALSIIAESMAMTLFGGIITGIVVGSLLGGISGTLAGCFSGFVLGLYTILYHYPLENIVSYQHTMKLAGAIFSSTTTFFVHLLMLVMLERTSSSPTPSSIQSLLNPVSITITFIPALIAGFVVWHFSGKVAQWYIDLFSYSRSKVTVK